MSWVSNIYGNGCGIPSSKEMDVGIPSLGRVSDKVHRCMQDMDVVFRQDMDVVFHQGMDVVFRQARDGCGIPSLGRVSDKVHRCMQEMDVVFHYEMDVCIPSRDGCGIPSSKRWMWYSIKTMDVVFRQTGWVSGKGD